MANKQISISLRLATPQDAEAMLQIQHDCVDQTFPIFCSKTIINMWKKRLNLDRYVAMTQISGSWCYVAVIQDKSSEQIVGFGYLHTDTALFPRVPMECKCDLEIRSLYVSVNHHRQGIGKKLMQEMESKALNEGCTRVGIMASMSALSFYEKAGYLIVQKRWYNFKPDKPEDEFSDGIYSLEKRVLVKDLQ